MADKHTSIHPSTHRAQSEKSETKQKTMLKNVVCMFLTTHKLKTDDNNSNSTITNKTS